MIFDRPTSTQVNTFQTKKTKKTAGEKKSKQKINESITKILKYHNKLI